MSSNSVPWSTFTKSVSNVFFSSSFTSPRLASTWNLQYSSTCARGPQRVSAPRLDPGREAQDVARLSRGTGAPGAARRPVAGVGSALLAFDRILDVTFGSGTGASNPVSAHSDPESEPGCHAQQQPGRADWRPGSCQAPPNCVRLVGATLWRLPPAARRTVNDVLHRAAHAASGAVTRGCVRQATQCDGACCRQTHLATSAGTSKLSLSELMSFTISAMAVRKRDAGRDAALRSGELCRKFALCVMRRADSQHGQRERRPSSRNIRLRIPAKLWGIIITGYNGPSPSASPPARHRPLNTSGGGVSRVPCDHVPRLAGGACGGADWARH